MMRSEQHRRLAGLRGSASAYQRAARANYLDIDQMREGLSDPHLELRRFCRSQVLLLQEWHHRNHQLASDQLDVVLALQREIHHDH